MAGWKYVHGYKRVLAGCPSRSYGDGCCGSKRKATGLRTYLTIRDPVYTVPGVRCLQIFAPLRADGRHARTG